MSTRYDTLWKDSLRFLFSDFLKFFFKDAERLFDLERGFEFLDKELSDLSPSSNQAPVFADKLIKVFTRQGEEQWLLIHIEIQGYKDDDMARRVFRYAYRIFDRYNQAPTTVVIYTDPHKNYEPNRFKWNPLAGYMNFGFLTYKVLDQSEAKLRASKNPFATLVLTVLRKLKTSSEEENQFNTKLALARDLMQAGFTEEMRNGLMSFIDKYISLQNPNLITKFEEAMNVLTNNDLEMGLRDGIIERTREEGREEGREQGREEEKKEIVKLLLTKGKMTDQQVADTINVSVDYVCKIRQEMGQ